jgi:hypothetical protein
MLKWLMPRGIAAAMPDHVALAFQFTRATLEHDPSADQYRSEIIRRWGPRAMMSLAFAILTARMYRPSSTPWGTARPARASSWVVRRSTSIRLLPLRIEDDD